MPKNTPAWWRKLVRNVVIGVVALIVLIALVALLTARQADAASIKLSKAEKRAVLVTTTTTWTEKDIPFAQRASAKPAKKSKKKDDTACKQIQGNTTSKSAVGRLWTLVITKYWCFSANEHKIVMAPAATLEARLTRLAILGGWSLDSSTPTEQWRMYKQYLKGASLSMGSFVLVQKTVLGDKEIDHPTVIINAEMALTSAGPDPRNPPDHSALGAVLISYVRKYEISTAPSPI